MKCYQIERKSKEVNYGMAKNGHEQRIGKTVS